MITIRKVIDPSPSTCRWCKKLSLEKKPIYQVTVKGVCGEGVFLICEECLRDFSKSSAKILSLKGKES